MDPTPQAVVLTKRQTRALWLLSTGRTCADIARDSGVSPSFMRKFCARVNELMGAATAAQAVRNGLLRGHIGPYEDCGSLAAYRRHIKRDEPICPACKRGNRERMDAEAAMRLRPVKLGRPEVQLLRAIDAGRTRAQIAAAWQISEQDVRQLITTTYAALGVDRLPPPVRREAALHEARVRGLLRNTPEAPARTIGKPAPDLSQTHLNILREMESGATLAETAERLSLRPGTCSTRLSETYRRLDVAWMEKGTRLPAALRKARELGLLPETATT